MSTRRGRGFLDMLVDGMVGELIAAERRVSRDAERAKRRPPPVQTPPPTADERYREYWRQQWEAEAAAKTRPAAPAAPLDTGPEVPYFTNPPDPATQVWGFTTAEVDWTNRVTLLDFDFVNRCQCGRDNVRGDDYCDCGAAIPPSLNWA